MVGTPQCRETDQRIPAALVCVLVIKWGEMAQKIEKKNEYKKDRITTYLWQHFFWQDIY